MLPAKFGAWLASGAARQHLHWLRTTLPADNLGLFEGQDLRVYRFLTTTPCNVRSIQRRLRGVDKSCLRSLGRAVRAGLAVECEPGQFAVALSPCLNLSEFWSDPANS